MNTIKDVYKVNYMRDKFSYVGCLRNEKLFNINDEVFFVSKGTQINKGRIIGVYLPLDENPEYRYKITISKEVVDQNDQENINYNLHNPPFDIICDKIFSSIEEAKESATKNLENMYKLQKEEIEKYFNQFE